MKKKEITTFENVKGYKTDNINETYKILQKLYKTLPSQTQSNRPKCFTGYSDDFLDELLVSIRRAKEINIIVSFLMESGVRLLLDDLEDAKNRGAVIRIITGRYLNITQPSALYLIKDRLGDYVDLGFYKNDNQSFHPKAYIFEYEDGGDIFIGSSNISEAALTYGIEWNYRLEKATNKEDFEKFKEEFMNIYLYNTIKVDEESLKEYSKRWKRPKILIDEIETSKKENKVIDFYRPKGAQIEALYELKRCRQEGYDKGLVVAATGIGKTYLAAFDSKEFKRVLFVAHREEILKQAQETFKNVRPYDTMGFFNADIKDIDKDIIFASVQTLGVTELIISSQKSQINLT